MTMIAGQRYDCLNPDCRCEIQVIKNSMEANSNPRCCCGAEMKKPYKRPTVTTLLEPTVGLTRSKKVGG